MVNPDVVDIEASFVPKTAFAPFALVVICPPITETMGVSFPWANIAAFNPYKSLSSNFEESPDSLLIIELVINIFGSASGEK